MLFPKMQDKAKIAAAQSNSTSDYTKPKLQRFGDVAELTQNVGPNGKGDGGGGGSATNMTGL